MCTDQYTFQCKTFICVFCFIQQAIGYGIIAVTFALQPLMKWACDRLTGIWRIAVVDVFIFLSFVGTANVWRGLWAMLDSYFSPGKLVFWIIFFNPKYSLTFRCASSKKVFLHLNLTNLYFPISYCKTNSWALQQFNNALRFNHIFGNVELLEFGTRARSIHRRRREGRPMRYLSRVLYSVVFPKRTNKKATKAAGCRARRTTNGIVGKNGERSITNCEKREWWS